MSSFEKVHLLPIQALLPHSTLPHSVPTIPGTPGSSSAHSPLFLQSWGSGVTRSLAHVALLIIKCVLKVFCFYSHPIYI